MYKGCVELNTLFNNDNNNNNNNTKKKVCCIDQCVLGIVSKVKVLIKVSPVLPRDSSAKTLVDIKTDPSLQSNNCNLLQ